MISFKEFFSFNLEAIKKIEAAGFFREAIRLDPNFSPAYSGLGKTLSLLTNYGERISLDRIYREEGIGIKDVFSGEFFKPQMLAILDQRSESVRPLIKMIIDYYEHNDVIPDLKSLISSIIHMSMNRIFMSRQRMHEMVIYDFLFRHYKSAIARDRYKKVEH